MIDAQKFVDLFGNKPSKEKKDRMPNPVKVKYAKVFDAEPHPRLIIEGETVASLKRYPRLSSYTPVIGDKVIVLNGTIIGNII